MPIQNGGSRLPQGPVHPTVSSVQSFRCRDGEERMRLYRTYDVGLQTDGVQRGLEMKDLRDLYDLMIHDVQPVRDE